MNIAIKSTQKAKVEPVMNGSGLKTKQTVPKKRLNFGTLNLEPSTFLNYASVKSAGGALSMALNLPFSFDLA